VVAWPVHPQLLDFVRRVENEFNAGEIYPWVSCGYPMRRNPDGFAVEVIPSEFGIYQWRDQAMPTIDENRPPWHLCQTLDFINGINQSRVWIKEAER
jgi:hypothetical protein